MYQYDYYNILNVNFNADSEQIYTSYKNLQKCITLLDFNEEYGQTVKLYPVVGGNLKSQDIDFSDF